MVQNSDIQPKQIGSALFFEVEQNTQSWYKLRSGLPTASGFHKIITPKTGRPSEQAEDYMNHLLAERMAGHTLEFVSSDMQEGHDREPESRRAFERTTKFKVKPGGFWTTLDGRIGVSPDGEIENEGGLLELKNPKAKTHVAYLRSKAVEREYWVQLQTGLYVTGYKFYMIQSYYPELPSVIIRVERDEEYIEKIADCGPKFCDRLDSEWESLSK